MADFTVRSDSVDVEQIMRQIRARIREKRGADYTEAELQQLASVKLEKFLDPRGVRSDLVDQFHRHRVVSPEPPKYEFEDTTLYDTHRGRAALHPPKLLHPILKLFVNPNPLIHALHVQKQVNDEFHKRFRQREEMDPLYYEVVHNLVVEITRLGIEVHNLKMRVESISSRMDFDERRARSLETVVQYRRSLRQYHQQAQGHADRATEISAMRRRRTTPAPAAAPAGNSPASTATPVPADVNGGTAPVMRRHRRRPRRVAAAPDNRHDGGDERRRRRRRRRRRPGQNARGHAGGSGDDRYDGCGEVRRVRVRPTDRLRRPDDGRTETTGGDGGAANQ